MTCWSIIIVFLFCFFNGVPTNGISEFNFQDFNKNVTIQNGEIGKENRVSKRVSKSIFFIFLDLIEKQVEN